jgi:hypothetical protein
MGGGGSVKRFTERLLSQIDPIKGMKKGRNKMWSLWRQEGGRQITKIHKKGSVSQAAVVVNILLDSQTF